MLQPSPLKDDWFLAIIALGANLPSKIGTPRQSLRHALKILANEMLKIQAVSQFFATPCFPAGAGPDYVNAAALLSTSLSPTALLSHLNAIEAEMGRTRTSRWGQRVLDLDLLAYGAKVIPDLITYKHWLKLPADQQAKQAPSTLILPHPRLQDRAFVLVPMAEIAPDWQHPVLGKTTAQMLADLDPSDITQIKPLQSG